MKSKVLVTDWFSKWESGCFRDLPITSEFKHTSPFGRIEGKDAYLKLVEDNQDKFLGYQFQVHEGIYEERKACVRYTAVQGEFKLDVSEWHYIEGDLIAEIIAYYHIGEIRADRELTS